MQAPSSASRMAALLLAVSPFMGVVAQQSTFPATPLVSKHFAYPTGIPYQADSDKNLIRGAQSGYNQCNSTTEGQASLCQTGFVNSLDDFCLWAPSAPNSLIADTEGEEVAWCTKPGRGTRLIPAGALKGLQFMRTPDYIQVVGFIDQTQINIQAGDFGGELDPHGADLRGNPLGGLLYSTAWSQDKNNFQQVSEWHNFMGANQFCFKACDPAGPNAANFCQHIYDRIGFDYNCPNAAKNGTFESCLGDNQDFPGVYTGTDGAVTTYSQPPESLGAISTMPYQPRVPASSSCTPFQSDSLYAALASVVPSAGSSAAPPASATGSAGSKSQTSGGASHASTGTATRSSSSSLPSATGTGGATEARLVGGMATVFGVVAAVVFLS